jgi:WD40 repeat protein
MDEFQDKPKRKREVRNPYLFLGLGISIGVILTAALLSGLYFWGQRQSMDVAVAPLEATAPYSMGLDFTETFVLTEASSLNAQGIEATVVAPRVQAAAVSADGRYLATTATDENQTRIILVDLQTKGTLSGEQRIIYHEGYAYFDDLLFSPDGSKLVATINQGIALLYDVETMTQIGEFPNIGGAAFNADGSLLALVGANNGIRLIDTETLTLVDSTEHDAYEVGAVSISSQNQLAIALDNRVEVYALANLAAAPQTYQVDSSFAYDLAFHPSGDYLAVSGDGFVQVLDLENNSRTMYNFTTSHIFALAFSPSGEWLAVAGGEAGYGESSLTVFRWNDSNVIPPDPAYFTPISLTGHEHTIFDVAFTPDDYLLSASWDGTVRLWDLNTREEISRLEL